MPKSYPPEFRRKVIDLVEAGRPIAQVAADRTKSDPADVVRTALDGL